MFPQSERREARDLVLFELREFVIRPGARYSGHARDEGTRRQHQRGIGSEVSRYFDSLSARANPDRSAFTVRRQQHHRGGKNMRQQITEPFRVANGRRVFRFEGKIVVRAETLELRPAFFSPRPSPQFLAHVVDLFPQEPRRAIATARFQFYDRRRDLDHTGVEVNRTAGRELEGAPGARQHFAPDKFLRGSENFLRAFTDAVNDQAEFRLQADDRARWVKVNPAAGFRSILFYDSLHSRGTMVR